ncbi:MAG: IS982 family transposase [Candidatus Poribacteria bacterium]|nr:IS982 family transposase [Candidatus Poribacteria bacterium]
MPQLSDRELLTIEIVGEFKGIDTDKELFAFFRREYGEWFPALRHIHRTTFVRQAANLWAVKERLREAIYRQVDADALFSIIDSFPIPVCRFARAKRCQRLREVSAYGYDCVAQLTFFGIKGHLVIEWPGVIADFRLPPGNVPDVEIAYDLLAEREGWALGDRNYWSPALFGECRTHGLELLTPYKSAKRETQRYPKELTRMRYRIDTVIGQLVERFHITKVRARDWWHQRSR